MNLHTPERQDGEPQDAYRARRAAAKQAVQGITLANAKGGFNSRETYRNALRSSGAMGKRTRASDALMAAWASKRITKPALRDEHGAYTCVGSTYHVQGLAPDTSREHVTSSWVDGEDMGYTARRKWLGGISAQRGF